MLYEYVCPGWMGVRARSIERQSEKVCNSAATTAVSLNADARNKRLKYIFTIYISAHLLYADAQFSNIFFLAGRYFLLFLCWVTKSFFSWFWMGQEQR